MNEKLKLKMDLEKVNALRTESSVLGSLLMSVSPAEKNLRAGLSQVVANLDKLADEMKEEAMK